MEVPELKLKYHPTVYEAAEDSWILQKEMVRYITNRAPKIVLDVGTGTGILALTAAKLGCSAVAVDIDLNACKLAKENASKNNLKIAIINGGLASAIKKKVDLIVFNPPYLPEDEVKTDIDRACLGGPTGTETFLRFAEQAKSVSKRVLFVYSSLEDVDLMLTELHKLGWRFSKLTSKKYDGEELAVGLLTLK